MPGPLAAAYDRARRRASPATRRRVKRLLNQAYWARRRLQRWIGRRGDSARELDRANEPWLPRDPLPAGTLRCVVASNEHGLYCIPTASRHRPVAQMVLQSRVWEADTLELIGNADRDGDIVHAGTYFGDFIPALARSRESGAIVWAFEPSRENYRCAQITTMLNDLDNVVLAHAALDSHDGGSAFLQTSNPKGVPLGGESRIVIDPDRARGQTKEEVQLVTVDEVIARDRRVAAIQLDVEGHEQRASDRCRDDARTSMGRDQPRAARLSAGRIGQCQQGLALSASIVSVPKQAAGRERRRSGKLRRTRSGSPILLSFMSAGSHGQAAPLWPAAARFT
jgi:FkbM family methyltransferase